jgi:hypothetical protein
MQTLSTSTCRYVGVTGELLKKGTKHIWTPTLSPTPTPLLVLGNGDIIRVLTPDRRRALHCHPEKPESRDSVYVCWTSDKPEGKHAVWCPVEISDGGTALRWNRLGEARHAALHRSWNLYLSVSDAGELVMSPTPYPWRLTATATPAPVLVVEEPSAGTGAGEPEPVVAPPPSALAAENERLRAQLAAARRRIERLQLLLLDVHLLTRAGHSLGCQ